MVHGREREGEVDEFGVSGYLHDNVFIMFDRKTESLWYPLDDKKWTAISGPRKGETIPFRSKPPIVSLGEWRKEHPKTVVLLGSKSRLSDRDRTPDSNAQPASPGGTANKIEFPITMAGRCAAAFFEAFNSGDDDVMRAFEKTHRAKSALQRRPIEDRIEQYHQLEADWERLEVGEIVGGDERNLSVLAYGVGMGEWLELRFELEEGAPHGLVAIYIKGPVPGPSADASTAALDAGARGEIVEEIAKVLSESYVIPDIAARMTETVRRNAAAGTYDHLTSPRALADRLTHDLHAVYHDKHLAVRISQADEQDQAPTDEDDDTWWAQDAWRNYGLEKVERLPGNVGYLKLNQFHPSDGAKRTAAAAMNFVANCDALIFDLRENCGGSPEMIAFLSGYLFDKRVHLNSFYNRREDKYSQTWSEEDVPGQRFGATKPVYVLTSGFTASGAEEFTYNLKNLKRGTIVGETTAGGAHLVFRHRINEDFVIMVPYARAINPITNTNWEGTGVEPDVKVPASRALLVAQKDALKRLIDTASDPPKRQILEGRLRRVERELAEKDKANSTRCEE